MAGKIIPMREKGGESEKVTINVGYVDLGRIDLLVEEGFYSNRTDFIRTAIRAQLTTHAEAVHHTVARKTLVLGVQHYSRRDLEAVRDVAFTVCGRRFAFRAGETIHTENSHKYGHRDSRILLRAAGWGVVAEWTDEREWFSILLADAEPPRFAP